MNNKGYSLSVTLITMNEEDRLERCLESVKDLADEIIILDSGSTDGTVEIAKKYTENIEITDWPGYGPQKQRALAKAKYEWVLSIDADESLTPELAQEIDNALRQKNEINGYKLPWAVNNFGHVLKYGRSARAVKRLFKREGAKFTNAQVHETIIIPNEKTATLKGHLTHYSNRDFEHFMMKSRKYSWLWSKEKFAAGRHGGGLLGASLRAAWTFFHIYFNRLGFLDGKVGFLVAVMYSQGVFNKYAGLWALQRQEKQNKG